MILGPDTAYQVYFFSKNQIDKLYEFVAEMKIECLLNLSMRILNFLVQKTSVYALLALTGCENIDSSYRYLIVVQNYKV
jgi:hypothetical protein